MTIEQERGITIEGESTDAKVMGLLPSELETNVIDQIRTMVDHEAFEGNVRVMPDTHVGSGATIGFTMPMGADPLRVCPNTIGVDIGCGMIAAKVDLEYDDTSAPLIEENVRDTVPMGYHQHGHGQPYNMREDFPYDELESKWERVKSQLDVEDPDWFDGFGWDEYIDPMCYRVEYDTDDVIGSMGTLGGGNHFIELCEDTSGDYWFVLHSGSRGIGLAIAQYWQDEATRFRTNDWIREQLPEELEGYVVPDMDDSELTQWFKGGKGQSYIDSDAIKEAVNDNYLIGYIHDQIRTAHPQHRDVNESLDYLEDQEAAGYLLDMVFAQTYAWENRTQMIELIVDAVDADIVETVHSPHNMIDFREPPADDAGIEPVLRKGATRAHEDERFVLPMNMSDGTFICRGNGNAKWNYTAPHGAGRVMSRTQAFNEVEMEDFEATMDDIYSTSVVDDTRDEAPQAYKDTALIVDAIEPTADIEHHLDPLINWKATE